MLLENEQHKYYSSFSYYEYRILVPHVFGLNQVVEIFVMISINSDLIGTIVNQFIVNKNKQKKRERKEKGTGAIFFSVGSRGMRNA